MGSLAAVPAAAAPPGAASTTRPVTAIGIVGDAGLNPLHKEFRTRDGRDPRYPAGMPRPVRIPMPKSASFDDAIAELAAGPLGDPKPGVLYALAGTRLLVYGTPGEPTVVGDAEQRLHGTGTASSAAGTTIGTSPDSLIVFVPGNGDAAYGWLADQRWVDVASTSVYAIPTTGQCDGADGARALHASGGLLFSSSGNLYDAYEPFATPNGLPEVYQVGGVDRNGKTWLPGHLDEPSPFFAAGNVIRPYETGARYSYPAAAGDSAEGTQPFGGTSGATPTVAGYAAELVAEARRLLADTGPRTDTALARRRGPAAPPGGGPLSDGTFTRDELVDVLHHAAVPAETAPGRYALEGFGATDRRSHAHALAVLRGTADLPARPDDQRLHDHAEALRGEQASRC
jgi:hypothetical protein